MIEINNKTDRKVGMLRLKRIAEKFYGKHGISGRQLSVALVGDRTIKRLNCRYLGKDRVTDVLAFPGESDLFGEIIIDLAQVARQAQGYGHTFAAELEFVLVHGLLHLIGYEDNTDKKRGEMDRLTEKFISEIRNT